MEALLQTKYHEHYNAIFKDSYTVEANEVSNTIFFLSNQTNNITNAEDEEAVLKINNENNYPIRLINIEKYISQYPPSSNAGKGKHCDLIIMPGNDTILSEFIFAELTRSKHRYIEPFTNFAGPQEGKRAKAVTQITETIKKLVNVPAIRNKVNEYNKLTGLFAYRLTHVEQNETNSKLSESLNRFNAPTKILESVSQTKILPHGFIFKQTLFDNPYHFARQ